MTRRRIRRSIWIGAGHFHRTQAGSRWRCALKVRHVVDRHQRVTDVILRFLTNARLAMDSMGATLMTDMSLFYDSDVTIPSVYGAPMTPRTMTVDAESSGQKEVDCRRA